MLAFFEDPTSAPPSDAVTRLFDLRFEAAKQFGVLDGQSWAVSVLDELRENESFLDQVVLLSAAEAELPGVKDHMLELLLAGGEDYELLFALGPNGPEVATLARRLGVAVTELGRAERGRGARGEGFSHF